jgi:DegV family protein with EDD domain
MARPTVLIVDREEPRRKELTRGLAGDGYEVVAAADMHEGRRFASGLEPGVIVAEAALVDAGDPSGPRTGRQGAGAPGPTTVLMCDARSLFDPPEGVLVAEVAGVGSDSVLHKIRTVLLGLEFGLHVDPLLESLSGELETVPLLELLPRLEEARFTGRVLAGAGEVVLEGGEVVAARVAGQKGLKAFCRLVRTAAGRFCVVLGGDRVGRELSEDILSLMALAIEDLHLFDEGRARLPNLSSGVRPGIPVETSGVPLAPGQRQVLEVARMARTVWDVLDRGAATDGSVLADVGHLVDLGVLRLVAPETGIRIVTDSGADIPAELARRHRIHVVPLTVTFGGQVFRDGEDLTHEQFYSFLGRKGAPRPLIGAPKQVELLTLYRTLGERDDVVSVHLSGRLCSVAAAASAAAAEAGDRLSTLGDGTRPAIEVVDTLQAGPALAMLVLLAARMAEHGIGAAEIRRRLEEMRERVHVLFVGDSPEYLASRGGLGRTRAFLARRLGVKPIFALVAGEVLPEDTARRGDSAHVRVVELLRQRVDPARPVIAGVGHASAPILAVRMRNLLQDSFDVREVVETGIGPAIGGRVGPGSVAAALLQPTDEEHEMLGGAVDVR